MAVPELTPEWCDEIWRNAPRNVETWTVIEWVCKQDRERFRAIPADRVLGDGEVKMEICDRDCREDDEDALEVLRVCGYGQQAEMLEVAIKAHALRANQGGAAT